MSEVQQLLPATRQAAALCQAVQRAHIRPARQGAAVVRKAGAEPVTIADYGAQAILCRAISRLFPRDAVIAEEGSAQFLQLVGAAERDEILRQISAVLGEPVSEAQLCAWLDHGQAREAARTWVIDPIDGTKGFIALRHYVVALGLLDARRQVVAGLLAAPGWPGGGHLLYTQAGQALAEPLGGGPARRLRASQRSAPTELLLLQSHEPRHGSQGRMARLRAQAGLDAARVGLIDSQEKYGRIAAGMGDLYLRLWPAGSGATHRIWDHAAGTALVQAAGGIVSDLDGSALDFTQGDSLARNQGVIAANPRIHERVVAAAQAMLDEERRAAAAGGGVTGRTCAPGLRPSSPPTTSRHKGSGLAP